MRGYFVKYAEMKKESEFKYDCQDLKDEDYQFGEMQSLQCEWNEKET